MLQAYTWDVPTNASRKGIWYDHLREQTQSNELARFTILWMPPPQKSDSGINSVGYDPFDYYDIGSYMEKFTLPTRYGKEAALRDCLSAMRGRGIKPIIDLVLNHNVGAYDSEGGSGPYNFAFQNHDTFEKIDPASNNSNQHYNANTKDAPFKNQTDFGPDVNIEHPYQRKGLENWGDWVSAKAGYDGYRWDATHHVGAWFVSEFMRTGSKQGQFSVMEYWLGENEASVREHETWLALTDYRSTTFDMRLHDPLEFMCNQNGTFNMSLLNRAGLVARQPLWSVTFAESHDTIRPYGADGKLGITINKAMAYAFILISEGLPMVAYNDYFIGPKADTLAPDDPIDDGWTGTPLTNEINRLIEARRRFVSGSSTYLSTANTNDLFVLKRSGSISKPGCILVINDNSSSSLSNTVNTGWTSTNLVDFINTNHVISTDGSGAGTVNAPPLSYRVYVRQGDL